MLGRAIATVREARDLTQKQLAVLVGVDPSYLSLIEADRRAPALDVVERIAGALDVPQLLLHALAATPGDLQRLGAEAVRTLGVALLQALVATPAKRKGAR